MWANTRMAAMLQVQYPIVQAPMARTNTVSLAAAVSNAGGLGSYAAGYETPEQLRSNIQQLRRLTPKPFAVNLFIPPVHDVTLSEAQIAAFSETSTYYEKQRSSFGLPPRPGSVSCPPAAVLQERFRASLEVVLSESVPIFSFTFGVPGPDIIKRCKEQGVITVGTATNLSEAKILEESSVDVVVVQASEAGGHRGTWYDSGDWRESMHSLAALLPQVVSAVSIPVIAAGGIMNGDDIIAALSQGAEGVVMGTAFLTTKEAANSEAQKQALLERRDLGTVVTRAYSGKPARSIRWPLGPIMDLQSIQAEPLPNYSFTVDCTDVVGAARQLNKLEWTVLWAGAGYQRCREVQPATQLFEQLVREANEAAQRRATA